MQQSNAENIYTISARRQFERDVYDFARNLKLSKKDAKKQVTRARHSCGEVEHDSHGSALGNEIPDVTNLRAASPAHSTTARHQVPSVHGEAPSSPQSVGGDESRKRKLEPEVNEVYGPEPPKKKKSARGKVKKKGAGSDSHISNGAEEKGPSVETAFGKKGKPNKTGADSDALGCKGSTFGPSGDDAQLVPDAESIPASSAPPENTGASNGTYVHRASTLPEADRLRRKERKKQRRMAERLAQKSTRDDQHASGTSGPAQPGEPTDTAALPSRPIEPTEPKSQAEAHENLLRANERDPNEGGPSTKKSKKDKRKSKEATLALDAELKALNAYSNEQQIDNFDKGQLNEVSKAVKDDIKDAKVEQERIREDDIAGKRGIEGSIRTSAEKKRRKKQIAESSIEQSEPKRKKSRKKHKLSDSGFPNPNDSVGMTAADEGLSSTDDRNTIKKSPTTPTQAYPDIDIEFPWSDSPLSSAPSSPSPPSPIVTANLHPHSQASPFKCPSRRRPAPTNDPITSIKTEYPALKRRPSSKTSPYFPPPPRPRRLPTSCIPFPPLFSPRFGLLQETLAHTPFHLLLACIFLTKTRGSVALPLFYTLIIRYPTASALAAADVADVIAVFQNLGLQNQRGRRVVALATEWVADEPSKGRRWRRMGYPGVGNGRDVKACEEPIPDEQEDCRVAWEIGHLPGVGRYALDSWRIFCRDRLRGVETPVAEYVSPFSEARGVVEEPQGEWTHVLPTDKELRAYLRWRWLRHGWEWDPTTGERRRASEKVIMGAEGGGVVVEGEGEQSGR